jgi:hypothetical protein
MDRAGAKLVAMVVPIALTAETFATYALAAACACFLVGFVLMIIIFSRIPPDRE